MRSQTGSRRNANATIARTAYICTHTHIQNEIMINSLHNTHRYHINSACQHMWHTLSLSLSLSLCFNGHFSRCASSYVVECWICNREVAGSNLSLRYFAPRSTQPSIPPGSVNEYQLQLGRQRQVWLIPIADKRVGVQVNWNPLRPRAIPKHFCDGDSLWRGIISSVCTFIFTFSRWTCIGQFRNVSILDFIGAKDDGGGGDNWSYKTCKAAVKSLPSTPALLA